MILFNNFGSGDAFDIFRGCVIGTGKDTGRPGPYVEGFQFTVVGSANLDHVDLGLKGVPDEALSGLDISLMTDSSGQPGSVIETVHIGRTLPLGRGRS